MPYYQNEGTALHECAVHLQNDARTCDGSDTVVTQARSLDVLASHLARLRPGHPAGNIISLLIGQLQNYERNPALLRSAILISCQRIEEARQ